MFPPSAKSKLAQRALEAARLARSFLLLEDDDRVDWEVGQDEPRAPMHPHRAALRSGSGQRRPGAPAPACHVCLTPVQRRGTLPARARTRRERADGGPACARPGPVAGSR